MFHCHILSPGEEEELGPPPSVDEAADALMTRLGFLLGDKVVAREADPSSHVQEDGQVEQDHCITFTMGKLHSLRKFTMVKAHAYNN